MDYNNVFPSLLETATYQTASIYNLQSAGAIQTNNLTMYTYTNNGSESKLYVNGILFSTNNTGIGSFPTINRTTISYILIGNDWGATSRAINGVIDDFTILNTSINSSEIQQFISYDYPFTTETETSFWTFVNQTASDLNFLNVVGGVSIIYNTTQNLTATPYYNYTTTNGISYINGTSYGTGYQTRNATNSTPNWTISIGDNEILPANYNYNETIMEATSHNSTTLSSVGDLYIIEFINLNTSKAYNVFEVMANTSGVISAYYCNSSYTSGKVSTSPFCATFGTLNTFSFNHSHNPSVNYSKHNLLSLPINNTGFINGIKATSTSQIALERTSGNMQIYFLNNNSLRSGAFKYSANGGSTLANQDNIVIDAHIHQLANSSGTSIEVFTYQICGNNSTGQNCSVLRTDELGLSPLPPSSAEITNPTGQRYQFNKNLNITWKASQPFNSSTTIASYNVSLLNTDLSFNATLNASTTNLYTLWNATGKTGSHIIRVIATDSLGQISVSYSDIFNITSSINISLKNAYTNATITNFSGWVYNTATGSNQTFNTTTNSSLVLLDEGLNQFYVEAPNYSISSSNYYNLTTNSTLADYTKEFRLYTSNSIYINILDEATSNPILQNISLEIQYLNTTLGYNYTASGVLFLENLNDGEYTLVFTGASGVNYTSRTYIVSVASQSTQSLNAFLTNTGTYADIVVKESLTGGVLEGASISLYRSINNTWTLIEVKESDITGRARFSYIANTKYRFIVQKTGFTAKSFDLNPITFDSYEVLLQRVITYSYTGADEDIQAVYSPQQYFNNQSIDFVILFTSPLGTLEDYGVNVSYPCGNFTLRGNNSIGERMNYTFYISCASLGSKVNVSYWYNSVNFGDAKFFRQDYYVSLRNTSNNHTFINLGRNDYGLGMLEKIVIITFLILILAGITYSVAGGIPALVIGLLICAYFVYTDFISGWVFVPTFIVGIIIILGNRER